MGSRRVRYDWVTSLSLFTFMHWRRKWQPTPVFLPGESQGWEPGGLPSMGSHRVGHDWRDLAAADLSQILLTVFISIIKVPRVTLPPLPHVFGSIIYNKWERTSLDPQVKMLAILMTITSELMCLNLAGFSINTDSDKLGWWKPINTISTLHFCTASQDYRWLTTGEYVRSKN